MPTGDDRGGVTLGLRRTTATWSRGPRANPGMACRPKPSSGSPPRCRLIVTGDSYQRRARIAPRARAGLDVVVIVTPSFCNPANGWRLVINPHQPEDRFLSRTGVCGIAFSLMAALRSRVGATT